MPASPADLFHRLRELGIHTTTVEHPPLRTVEESRALRGEIAGGHSKNLFLKDKKGALFLFVAEEDAELSVNDLHKALGSARLSFGRADLLLEALGVLPGSVTPFAAMNDTAGRVKVVLDAGLMRHERLNFHPLENTATTTIQRDDLLKFLRDTGHEPQVLAAGAPSTRERPV